MLTKRIAKTNMRTLSATILLDKEGTTTSGTYTVVQWQGRDYIIWARRGDLRILVPYDKTNVKTGVKGHRPYLNNVVPRIGELAIDKKDLYAHLGPDVGALMDML